ncbi:MAG: CoA-binding protein, partial [Chloroflexi bacterium]|nr:CoA-binding protein [Chloroflexota bacterium]
MMNIDRRKALDRVFNPRAIAVFGDSSKYGFIWLNSLRQFKGKVYCIQLNEAEAPAIRALGGEHYKSIRDVPEPVDYVVVSVPKKAAAQVLSECIEKKAGGVSYYTAGFAESDEEGAKLQKDLADMASRSSTLLLGPNCLGIYRGELGVRFDPNQPIGDVGDLAFMAQSGGFTSMVTTIGAQHGLKFNKAVSFGNGAMLEATDYLEYFAQDPAIKLIGAYIEGVRDGHRFFQALKDATSRKPVVIWKGGRTPTGARAAASHTGALASDQAIWNTVLRQAGAVRVDHMDEMLDVMKMLRHVRPLVGPRMALIATAGGQSVMMDDAFSEQGLQVPMLTEASYQELGSFVDTVGGSYRNPLDVSRTWRFNMDPLRRILRILEHDDNVDAVVIEVSCLTLARRKMEGRNYRDQYLDLLVEFQPTCKKPFFVILTSAHLEQEGLGLRDDLTKRGIPSFPTFHRAARAYRLALDY